MAGIIVARDPGLNANDCAGAPATAYRRMAPDARTSQLKVATAGGGTDVSDRGAGRWDVPMRGDIDLRSSSSSPRRTA
jgi:hypothetical protein